MLQAFELLIIVAATGIVVVVISLGLMMALAKLSGKKKTS